MIRVCTLMLVIAIVIAGPPPLLALRSSASNFPVRLTSLTPIYQALSTRHCLTQGRLCTTSLLRRTLLLRSLEDSN